MTGHEKMLYQLIPNPITVCEPNFSGCLYIDGNISSNRLLFRFRFDRSEELTPLFITVLADEKSHRYICNRRDLTNPEIKSQVLSPDYQISKGFKVTKIEALFNAVFDVL